MNPISDRELVGRCKSELPYETRSFERLVDRYKDLVFAKIYGMLRDAEESQDVSQDVFIKVFQGIRDFREASAFSTWIYAITVNTCLNHLEKARRRPGWWIAGDDVETDVDRMEDVRLFATVTGRVENEERRRLVESALGRLSPGEREIIRLRYYDEKDTATIAATLGVGLSAAKMRLSRARDAFRVAYLGAGGTE